MFVSRRARTADCLWTEYAEILRLGHICLDMPTDPADLRSEHRQQACRWIAVLPCDAALSHHSAAIVDGFSTYDIPELVTVTRTCGRPERTSDIRVLRAQLRPELDVAIRDGVRRTTAARTVVDLGRRLPFAEALVTADDALRRRRVTRRQLEAMLRFQYHWPRIRRAMPVVRWASPKSESPLESLVRARIIRLRLPMPEQQIWVGDQDNEIGRVDFYWREQRLVGEADGRAKYTDDSALWAEKLRQEMLEDAGFTVIRWTWSQAHADDETFSSRLLRALDRAERNLRSRT